MNIITILYTYEYDTYIHTYIHDPNTINPYPKYYLWGGIICVLGRVLGISVWAKVLFYFITLFSVLGLG